MIGILWKKNYKKKKEVIFASKNEIFGGYLLGKILEVNHIESEKIIEDLFSL